LTESNAIVQAGVRGTGTMKRLTETTMKRLTETISKRVMEVKRTFRPPLLGDKPNQNWKVACRFDSGIILQEMKDKRKSFLWF
jgi:hypothetical protein